MAIKAYKPTTAGRRGMTTRQGIATQQRKVKSLLLPMKVGSGRNNQGKITIRHRGGGVKRFYRLVDFKLAPGLKGTVKAIEYDPNRSANIALLELSDGTPAYILAGSGMKVGEKVGSGSDAEIRRGNRLPLKSMPVGTSIYNVELVLGKGGQLARSAGARAQLVAKEGEFCQVRLPSGEVRLVHQDCQATIGSVGNEGHQNVKYGSAGRRRRLGWRPAVRGKAMNPVDHPHGGGEAQNSIGLDNPKTPWGKPALGLRTRNRKATDSMIIRRRKQGRRR